MSDDLSDRAAMALMFGLFFLIGGVMLFDVMTDYREGVSVAHLLVESVVLLLAGVGCGVVLIRGYQARRSLATLRNDLQHAQRRAVHWQRENEKQVQGIAQSIKAQFAAWGYTEAESDVALLLIKGLSHREIASLRNTSERTVRHQAQAAYRKASLPGRTALSAFFLEDMLPGR